MKDVTPVVKINPQSLTEQPFTPDSTLVNDPVALVNDPVALSGGNTTIISNIRAQIRVPKIFSRIKKRR